MSKANKHKTNEKKKGGFAAEVNALLLGTFLTVECVQSNIPLIFFVVAITVCYIAYEYYAENNMQEMVDAYV